jgi:thymidylate synthase (FAD)
MRLLTVGDSKGKFGVVGEFEILQSMAELQRQLLNIEKCGRICYRSEERSNSSSNENFVRRLVERGHESVIEHSLLTVIFSKVSRGFTHELVRHRLCAFSQESTRYVDYANPNRIEMQFIMPPFRDDSYIEEKLDKDGSVVVSTSPSMMLQTIEEFYVNLRKAGWAPEEARQILPNALASKIAVSANFREWRHIFEVRTQPAAHWEIRSIMCKLLKYCKEALPPIFFDFEFGGVDKNGIPFFRKGSLNS